MTQSFELASVNNGRNYNGPNWRNLMGKVPTAIDARSFDCLNKLLC